MMERVRRRGVEMELLKQIVCFNRSCKLEIVGLHNQCVLSFLITL